MAEPHTIRASGFNPRWTIQKVRVLKGRTTGVARHGHRWEQRNRPPLEGGDLFNDPILGLKPQALFVCRSAAPHCGLCAVTGTLHVSSLATNATFTPCAQEISPIDRYDGKEYTRLDTQERHCGAVPGGVIT